MFYGDLNLYPLSLRVLHFVDIELLPHITTCQLKPIDIDTYVHVPSFVQNLSYPSSLH